MPLLPALRLTFVSALLLFGSVDAFAFDGSVSGSVGQIEVTSAGNYGFRLYLVNSPALCGNANTWAYLDPTDSNYNSYVAAIMMAKSQNLTVTVHSWRDTTGYCHIAYIQIM